ncbi:MAG: type II toxin-antitoxin system VapC family toxin [Beijerinckiaceae bacterium]
MTTIPTGAAVYLDANVFIYWVEGAEPMFGAARKAFDLIIAASAKMMTSDLAVAECLYQPCRNNNAALVASFEEFLLSNEQVELLPLNGQVALNAARNGGAWGLKLLDAIHYATALEHGCAVFVTADRRFRSSPDMKVMVIG